MIELVFLPIDNFKLNDTKGVSLGMKEVIPDTFLLAI